MKKVKNIEFEVELEGEGVVNYNGSNVTKALERSNSTIAPKGNDNVMYGKANYYYREKNDIENDVKYLMSKNIPEEKARAIVPLYDRVPKISSNCIRSYLFRETNNFDAMLMEQPVVAANYVSSSLGYLRGYLHAKEGNSFGRKSVITVTDFESINCVYNMETLTKNGQKTENSFFLKETIGKTIYKGKIAFDVSKAQFLCLDDYFGKRELGPAIYETGLLKKAFEQRLGYVPYVDGVYTDSSAVFGNYYGQYGYRFSDKFVNWLLTEFVDALLKFEIKKAGAYAKVKSINMHVIYDPIEKDEDVVEITKKNYSEFNFDYESFWTEANRQEFYKRAEMIETIKKNKKINGEL